MKIAGKVTTLAGLLIFAGLGGRVAYAQFEVHPDHFDLANSEPFENGNARGKPTPARANAGSTQPHCNQCSGSASARGIDQSSPAPSRKPRPVRLIQKGPGATDAARRVETVCASKTRAVFEVPEAVAVAGLGFVMRAID